MKRFQTTIRTYGVRVVLFVGGDVREHIKKIYGEDTGDVEKFDGWSKKIQRTPGIYDHVIWLSKWRNSAADIGRLTHEVFHCSVDILRDRGIYYGKSTEEATAYLIQELMEVLLTKLRRKQVTGAA